MSQDTLAGFSVEVLIKIFSYLDVYDLCRLRLTCRRFYDIINSWDHIIFKGSLPNVTNQKSELFLQKCIRQLSTFEKWKILQNWEKGRYCESSPLFTRKKYIPILHLDNKLLWISQGQNITAYTRNDKHIDIPKPYSIVSTNDEISSFQIKKEFLVCGKRNGSIEIIKNAPQNREIFNVTGCHYSDIHSVDLSERGDLVITGSRDELFKIWEINPESENVCKLIDSQVLYDRIWKLSLSKLSSVLAVGTAGNSHFTSLYIYDLERQTYQARLCSSRCQSAGVLDIKWDQLDTLWTCGYDTCLRRWDLRTGKCEQTFSDPFGSVLYCLDYDYCNTILTGTSMHGRVVLWDTRSTCFKQLYYMRSCKRRSSPVYSLAFDSEYLFAATDQNLNVLHFSDPAAVSSGLCYNRHFDPV